MEAAETYLVSYQIRRYIYYYLIICCLIYLFIISQQRQYTAQITLQTMEHIALRQSHSKQFVLKRLRSNLPQQIIIGHLNINSIRNKFDIMKPMLLDDTDIFMVTETKLDDSFPVSQFNVEGFSTPFRLDRNKNGGGIILYIRSYIIASKLTSFTFPNDIEAFFIEINLKGNKWLICCSYNPNRTFVSNHLDHIAKGINTYSKKYEKILLMGDFNVAFTEANMAAFCNEYKLKALNKEPTCFKNYMSPSCIDLYLTNCPKSFESTLTIETGLSDFHKLIVTVLTVNGEKVPLKIIHYRDYKHFESTRSFEKLQVRLTHLGMNSLV